MEPEAVAFDANEFKGSFPEFSVSDSVLLTNCFVRAEGFLANSAASPVSDLVKRKTLLYLATAHIAALASRGSSVVGQVTTASQGSVSTAFSALQPGKADWWNQTQYGAEFWAATAIYRSFQYV